MWRLCGERNLKQCTGGEPDLKRSCGERVALNGVPAKIVYPSSLTFCVYVFALYSHYRIAPNSV